MHCQSSFDIRPVKYQGSKQLYTSAQDLKKHEQYDSEPLDGKYFEAPSPRDMFIRQTQDDIDQVDVFVSKLKNDIEASRLAMRNILENELAEKSRLNYELKREIIILNHTIELDRAKKDATKNELFKEIALRDIRIQELENKVKTLLENEKIQSAKSVDGLNIEASLYSHSIHPKSEIKLKDSSAIQKMAKYLKKKYKSK